MTMGSHKGEEGAKLVEHDENVIRRITKKARNVCTHKGNPCKTKSDELTDSKANLIFCSLIVSCPFRCIFLGSEE